MRKRFAMLMVTMPLVSTLLAVAACLFAPLSAHADIAPEVRASAEAGDAESQLRLGLALLYGTDGLAMDQDAGITWLKKSAAQGNGDAQFYLGDMSSDQADKFRWFELSAKQGNPLGQFGLAEQLIFITAAMTRYYPDAVEGLDLLQKSAAQDNPQAAYLLGDIYSQNLPSPAIQIAKLDVAKAREWYAKALALGWPEAQDRIDALKGKANSDFEPKDDIETVWSESPTLHELSRQRAEVVKAMREGRSSAQ
ncbi:tetratricopeptide repeat protein [Asticcacaulis sp. 201]|uniref:tetratricopeptide repeat protein n=1 Tax=Asticcacaulis sp. 201 TaxID=3028787 RepID=UPI002916E2DD|nr:tetratricopeptide repeat protein [Asticcacaulis sp. 201]MDV6329955.1 tetratricopeptide repeat protein [Asticcacaulis sp. 201]